MDRAPLRRAASAASAGAKKSLATLWLLAKIMVPTSLAMAILGWSGAAKVISVLLSPLMGLLGLPGEAALAFISGILLTNYSAIAVMNSLTLNLRHVAILAFMSLTAHNLAVESAVMKSAGSSALKMTLLRVGVALAGAFVLNLILPRSLGEIAFSAAMERTSIAFLPMLGAWALSTLRLIAKLTLFVVGIMVLQAELEEFKVLRALSSLLSPLMRVFGLPPRASFLWIVVNTVGYAYGAGIIRSEYESGKMKPQEGDLFNHHAAICHSLLEDTILYSALGIPVLWLVAPRLVFAAAVVWAERARRHRMKKSFKVGTI